MTYNREDQEARQRRYARRRWDNAFKIAVVACLLVIIYLLIHDNCCGNTCCSTCGNQTYPPVLMMTVPQGATAVPIVPATKPRICTKQDINEHLTTGRGSERGPCVIAPNPEESVDPPQSNATPLRQKPITTGTGPPREGPPSPVYSYVPNTRDNSVFLNPIYVPERNTTHISAPSSLGLTIAGALLLFILNKKG